MATIRTGWSGGTLGQANATEERKRRLPAGSYRLAVVVGFQLEHAVILLNDHPAGTPQRVLWMSAVDPTISGDTDCFRPEPWTPPTWPTLYGIDPSHEMGVPDHVAATIRAERLERNQGKEFDPLDAHHNLNRLKVAGLLAIHDQRTDIDPEDWDLAGVVMDTSRAVRSAVAAHARALAASQERQNTARAIRRLDAIDESAEGQALARMARAIANHVHRKSGPDHVCKKRCVTRATRSTDQKQAAADDAVARAVDQGWITDDGDTYRPGETRPA